MLTSTASSGVSMSGTTNVYTNSRKYGIAPSEEKEHKYDSAQFSAVQGGDTAFRKELLSHISKEVRTATTTGDIQKYRREILEGTYTPDPMAIAGRILFFSED